MPLKYRYDKQTDIPSDQVGHYKEHNGSFILDVDGAVDKSRLDEFRASTLALTKERDDLRQRFDGIDPAEVRKLADEKRKLEEAQQLKAGEVDKVIETRIKSVRGDLEKQISNLTSERDALTSRLTAIQIDQGILTAATKRGIRPTAMPDILARARSVFRLINGAPVALESDGQTPRAGRDGVTPMTMDEWINAQLAEAPHLFGDTAGYPAALPNGSGSSTGGGSGSNPFRKQTWNLTEQMRLQRTNPGLAHSLRAMSK